MFPPLRLSLPLLPSPRKGCVCWWKSAARSICRKICLGTGLEAEQEAPFSGGAKGDVWICEPSRNGAEQPQARVGLRGPGNREGHWKWGVLSSPCYRVGLSIPGDLESGAGDRARLSDSGYWILDWPWPPGSVARPRGLGRAEQPREWTGLSDTGDRVMLRDPWTGQD